MKARTSPSIKGCIERINMHTLVDEDQLSQTTKVAESRAK